MWYNIIKIRERKLSKTRKGIEMEVITSYRAFDGKFFKTEKECLEYEKECLKREEEIREQNELLEKANDLKDYCINHDCCECFFSDGYGNCAMYECPNKWDV